jgi:serine/threonine protein kinase
MSLSVGNNENELESAADIGGAVSLHLSSDESAAEINRIPAAVRQRYAVALANLLIRYKFQSVLGEGVMGVVFKVIDRQTKEKYAVKLLRPELVNDAIAVERFKREAKIASSLISMEIAKTFQFGFGKYGAPYLVMEYIAGEDLATFLRRVNHVDFGTMVRVFYSC